LAKPSTTGCGERRLRGRDQHREEQVIRQRWRSERHCETLRPEQGTVWHIDPQRARQFAPVLYWFMLLGPVLRPGEKGLESSLGVGMTRGAGTALAFGTNPRPGITRDPPGVASTTAKATTQVCASSLPIARLLKRTINLPVFCLMGEKPDKGSRRQHSLANACGPYSLPPFRC
jgi:hypothetical protein